MLNKKVNFKKKYISLRWKYFFVIYLEKARLIITLSYQFTANIYDIYL